MTHLHRLFYRLCIVPMDSYLRDDSLDALVLN